MTDATIIKAECPSCGEVTLKPAQIRLTDGPRPAYSFWCSQCGDTISKTADGPVMTLLLSGGVVVEHIPLEVWEPHSTEALTIDYAIDLHADIEAMGVEA